MEDIYVYVVALPGYCREMVARSDSETTVYVSRDLSDEQKLDAINHALTHIESGHMDGEAASADEAEADARRSPDFAPIWRYRATDEDLSALRRKAEK